MTVVYESTIVRNTIDGNKLNASIKNNAKLETIKW